MALRYARTSGGWNSTARWSTTASGATGASVPTSADDVIFTNTNNVTITVDSGYTGSCKSLTINSGCTGGLYDGGGTSTLQVYGNMNIASTARFDPTNTAFNWMASGTLTTNGHTGLAVRSMSPASATATLTLADSVTLVSGSFGMDRGTLAIGAFNVTCSAFGTSSAAYAKALTRTTGAIYIFGASSCLTIRSGGTYTWPSNNTPFYLTNTSGTARYLDLSGAGSTTTTAFNITVYGSGTVNLNHSILSSGIASYVNNLTFDSTFTGSVVPFYTSPYTQIFGSLQLSSSMSFSSNNQIILAGSGSGNLSSGGATLDCPLYIDRSGGTVTLTSNFTVGATRTTILNQGTLALSTYTFNTGIFSSNVSNTRGVNFGSNGRVSLTNTTASTTILDISQMTGFTRSGTGDFYRTGSTTATISMGNTVQPTEANSCSLTLAGSGGITISTGSVINSLDMSGMTAAVTAPSALIVYGDFKTSSSGVFTSGSYSLQSSSTSTITPNGGTVGYLDINGTGTFTLAGAFVATGTGLYVTKGTFNTGSFSVTTTYFQSTGVNTRSISLGSSTVTVTGSTSTAWQVGSTGLTLSAGTSTVSMNSSSPKGFVGGGKTYYVLSQTGTGTLTIDNSNTFNTLTNTVYPTTITFTSGTTQTITNNFGLSGVLGSLVTINSTAFASPFTLSKSSGTVSVNYVSVNSSTATGGATWLSLLTNGNINGDAYNSGWIFTLASGQMLMMFQ